MLKLLRWDLLHVPNVIRMVGTVETMRCPFFPPVISDLEAPHEVLSGQHRMLLVPDDALREVESAVFQHRWVVSKISIPTPDVECSSWFQYACHVPEPRVKQSTEFFIADEVVR